MVGRTQVIVSDESGLVSIIEGQGGCDLEEESYFRFVVGVRMDKDEPVLYSQRRDRVENFNQIQYHMASVMTMVNKMPVLQV